ncbi:hypothetical protein [Legionella sp. km772]|uniref:hypothetical protein n=1 Tax=Legionella sp. km772 TaxID=2498111 RepID=UPI000F8EAFF8|nr:hypothetical protein [Legionella sp. km772]RUR04315.1 hypothetical protein ELY15_15640 [Legionella sp. km772]
MPHLLKNALPVNFIWIGPPSNLPGSSGVVAHDVKALIELWAHPIYENQHQILFWCLDEFVPYYQELLKEYLTGDNPIQVCSIQAYLQEFLEEEYQVDLFYEETINHDALLVSSFFKLFLKKELSETPIADRVSCKELFSLFLLRSLGGYVLDTNVSLSANTATILPKPEAFVQFMLPASYLITKFKGWMRRVDAQLPWECFECWAMYSSGANEITIPMVRQFIALAGYTQQGSGLVKLPVLLRNVETYLKKEELDKYQASLSSMSATIIRQMVQCARGLPIMSTVTASIRKAKENKSDFFSPSPSAIKLIKIEKDPEDIRRLIAPELGIVKTYNNTHVPSLESQASAEPPASFTPK